MSARKPELLNSCVDALESAVNIISKYGNKEQVDVLLNIAKSYCLLEADQDRSEAALRATEEYFDNPDNDCTEDVLQIYNQNYDTQPYTDNYKENTIWKKINKAIRTSVPSDANTSQSMGDCDLLMSQSFQLLTDPFTKQTIRNPCKNKICGHVYEYDTCMSQFKNSKSVVKCPYIGCTNTKTRKSDIVVDDELRQKIEKHLSETDESQ